MPRRKKTPEAEPYNPADPDAESPTPNLPGLPVAAAPRATPPADDTRPDKTWRKISYRGYMLYNLDMERMIRCDYNNFYAPKMIKEGHPNHIWWPVPHDHGGAKDMIDAVLSRDVGRLRGFRAEYPGHTFGFETLIPEGASKDDVMRCKFVRSRSLARGHRLDVELVQYRDGRLHLRAAIRRGNDTLAAKVLRDYTARAAVSQSTTA